MNYLTSKCIRFAFLFFSFLVICGCSDKAENTIDKKEESANTNEEHKDEVALTEKQILLMNIAFSKINLENLSGYIKVNGEVKINPDQESKVGSLISGRVRKIFVKEGSFVRAGQTLAVIENPELINVQVEYINAKNEYEFSKKEYERQLTLSQENIGSKKNLAELEANYKKALAEYKTHEEKLSTYNISKNRFNDFYKDTIANLQRYYSIAAPISGNIVTRMVTVGQFVEPSTDMFHIVNTSTIYVDLNVFEKDLPHIGLGQKVTIEVNGRPDELFEGKVIFINKVFDDKNRTVKVRVSIDNKEQVLLPFMFVSAKIYVTEGSVLAVPVTALESEGDEKFIFVKTDERVELEKNPEHSPERDSNDKEEHTKEVGIVFKKVLVNTGLSDEHFVEIFPVGNTEFHMEVVTKGTFYLKSELKKDELGGEE